MEILQRTLSELNINNEEKELNFRMKNYKKKNCAPVVRYGWLWGHSLSLPKRIETL